MKDVYKDDDNKVLRWEGVESGVLYRIRLLAPNRVFFLYVESMCIIYAAGCLHKRRSAGFVM